MEIENLKRNRLENLDFKSHGVKFSSAWRQGTPNGDKLRSAIRSAQKFEHGVFYLDISN